MGRALAPEDTYEKGIDSENLNSKLSFVVFILELYRERERVVIGFFIFRMPTTVVLTYVISINDSIVKKGDGPARLPRACFSLLKCR